MRDAEQVIALVALDGLDFLTLGVKEGHLDTVVSLFSETHPVPGAGREMPLCVVAISLACRARQPTQRRVQSARR